MKTEDWKVFFDECRQDCRMEELAIEVKGEIGVMDHIIDLISNSGYSVLGTVGHCVPLGSS